MFNFQRLPPPPPPPRVPPAGGWKQKQRRWQLQQQQQQGRRRQGQGLYGKVCQEFILKKIGKKASPMTAYIFVSWRHEYVSNHASDRGRGEQTKVGVALFYFGYYKGKSVWGARGLRPLPPSNLSVICRSGQEKKGETKRCREKNNNNNKKEVVGGRELSIPHLSPSHNLALGTFSKLPPRPPKHGKKLIN